MKEKNEDIDLIEFILLLWNGKWIITVFTIITTLFGSIFILTQGSNENGKVFYESKIYYTLDVITPITIDENFQNKDLVIKDFQKLFYSKNIF